MTNLTFYGGVNEIGGNKFLIEDKGTKIFLDFGMQMGKANNYFAEFLKPRKLNGIGDLLEFGLLPKLRGLYRTDYTKHMGFDDDKDSNYDAVLLTHAHIDHCAYIHYLRPEIPIHCTEATKLIMQALEDTSGDEEYITYKESFKTYENNKGTLSRARDSKNREEKPRNIKIIENNKKFNIDSIEIEPLTVDHSLPGVCGFILHTSKGSLAYTADIRFHGRRKSDSEKFVERCGSSDLDLVLCEGTRINKTTSKTEFDVEFEAKAVVDSTKKLVVCTYPVRDLDRLLSFYNTAKETGRNLVIDFKQAYLLKLFQTSDAWKNIYPKPDDPHIKIFMPKKSWGLIDKNVDVWTEKIIHDDYEGWEEEFLDYTNAIHNRDVAAKQKDFIFFCDDYHLQQLIDVRPEEGSSYIRSSTEPFDDEMALDQERIKRWLVHFGLISRQDQWNQIHVSGHGSGDQISDVVKGVKAKKLVPIHTEAKDLVHFGGLHDNITKVQIDDTIEL